MAFSRESAVSLIGAFVAVLLQIILAPNIAFEGIVPNFLAAFCVARAVAVPHGAGPVIPFCLGFLFDLMGGGPVGAMAFVLVLVTFASSRAFAAWNNDTLFMPVAVILISVVFVEVLYGVLMTLAGGVTLVDALVYRAIPCMLYDGVIALLFYPIALRAMVGRPQDIPGSPVLR